MSTVTGRSGDEHNQSKITGAVVDFLEDHGVTTYAVRRSPSSIVLSLPNEPEIAVQRHVEGLKGRLQEINLETAPASVADQILRDPRDHHAIIIEIKAPHDELGNRDAIVRLLKSEESELRRRGIDSLLLFGSVATLKPYPNDIDLLARFRTGLRPSAFDIAEIQAYLEQKLGRRVDLSMEKSFPNEFRENAERSGIRIFGA